MPSVDNVMRCLNNPVRLMKWQRIALTRRQIDTSLTVGMGFDAATKADDSRYCWFVEHYGQRCWELDALSPAYLRRDAEEAIKGNIVQELWDRCQLIEQAARDSLKEILDDSRSSAASPIARRDHHAIDSERMFHPRGQLSRRPYESPGRCQAHDPGVGLLVHLGADRQSAARRP
jgi:hypothetical protein